MSRRTQRAKARQAPPPEDARMLALLERHARHPVHLEIDVITGQVLVGALQLAMRHPAFPSTSRRIIHDFVRGWQRQVAGLDGDLAILTEMGNQPHRDVPSPGCRWCGEGLEAHQEERGEWYCPGSRRVYARGDD